MGWLKVLKDLFQKQNNTDVALKVDTEVHTKKNSDNREQNIVFNVGTINVLNVPVDSEGMVPNDALEQLRSVVIPAFKEGKLKTLEDKSKDLLSAISDFRSEPEINGLITFFNGKISQSDLRLLESGLYEAYLLEHNQSDKAKMVKSGLQNRYGTRGLNIVNLASRGYFKSHIRPLYEALDEVGRKDDFPLEYKRIVDDLPFAVFVTSGMSESVILAKFIEKSEKNIKYGVEEDTIAIYGFGSASDTIEKLIPELKNRYRRVAPTVNYLGTLRSIQVDVFYKEKTEDITQD